MALPAPDSQIKLIIKLHSSSGTQKQLVLYVPRSKKREPSSEPSSDTRCNKRCKVVSSEVSAKPTSKTDIECSSVKNIERTRAIIAKDSRTVYEEVAKTRKVATDHEVSAYPIKSGGTTDECGVVKAKWRISKTTGSEEKEKKKQPLMMKRRVVTKDSRIIYEGCERKEGVNNSSRKKMKMMRKVATDKVSAVDTDQYPTKSFAVVKSGTTTQYCGAVKERGRVGSGISRTGCEEECKLKKKEEKKARVVVLMDRCKKMQCWVMLKRLMTGRDSWVFKQPMMGLEILDNNYSVDDSSSVSKPFIKSEIVYNEIAMKPIGLKDIESKLNKFMYTEPDEFADDIRVVLSYGLLHPQRNVIYKIARRVSEDFELSWKSLKDKWLTEEREKGRRFENISAKEVDEKKINQ